MAPTTSSIPVNQWGSFDAMRYGGAVSESGEGSGVEDIVE